MKKSTLAVAASLLLLGAGSAFASGTDTATVTFSGTLTPATCTLSSNVMGTMNLGSLDTLSVPTVSSFSPSSSGNSFTLTATGCDDSTNVALEITGTTVVADGKNILGNSGDATGVGIILGDVTSNTVISPSATGTTLQLANCTDGADNGCISSTTSDAGEASWNFASAIVATGDKVTAGSISASATFQIVYE